MSVKCPYCGSSNNFKLEVLDNIKDSKFAITFIACNSCSSAIGVLDYYSLKSIHDKLDGLKTRIN